MNYNVKIDPPKINVDTLKYWLDLISEPSELSELSKSSNVTGLISLASNFDYVVNTISSNSAYSWFISNIKELFKTHMGTYSYLNHDISSAIKKLSLIGESPNSFLISHKIVSLIVRYAEHFNDSYIFSGLNNNEELNDITNTVLEITNSLKLVIEMIEEIGEEVLFKSLMKIVDEDIYFVPYDKLKEFKYNAPKSGTFYKFIPSKDGDASVLHMGTFERHYLNEMLSVTKENSLYFAPLPGKIGNGLNNDTYSNPEYNYVHSQMFPDLWI